MNKLQFTNIYLWVFLVAVFITLANINISQDVLIIGLGIAVVLLGLPHGALDLHVAKSLNLVSSFKSGFFFMVCYVVIAAISILFWIKLPAIGLVLFLAVSLFHFASDWRDIMPNYAGTSLACIILSGPAIQHSEILVDIFSSLLLSIDEANKIILGMQALFGLSILLFLTYLATLIKSASKVNRWQIAESVTLISGSLLLHPLIHFGLYFCLLHSPKHLLDVSSLLGIKLSKLVIISLPIVVLTLVIAIILYKIYGTADITNDLLRWIFIGLFGLTMSHMALISFWHRSHLVRS
jgi:Brp/Blh family beta-carotene 15,15'-monooxygenase